MSLFCCPCFSRPAITDPQAYLERESIGWHIDHARTQDYWSVHAEIMPREDGFIDSFLSICKERQIKPENVLELGCRNGTYTLSLIKNGCNVVAVDSNKRALQILRSAFKELQEETALYNRQHPKNPIRLGTLKIEQSSIENFIFKNSKFDVILAINSLNYCNPKKVLGIWERVHQALKGGGLFVCALPTRPMISIPAFSPSVAPSWYVNAQIFRDLMERYRDVYSHEEGPCALLYSTILSIGSKV